MTALPSEDPTTTELTREEFDALLEQRTRRQFGLSLDEFRRAFEAGEFDDHPGAMNIAILLNGHAAAAK